MRKLFCLFGLFTVTLTAKEPIRTWTNTDGQTIEARFIDEKMDKVRIRRTDGRVFNIPLDTLSEVDQKYVKSLAVDKLRLSTDPKDNVEDIYSKPTGSDARKYGSKPNYFVKSALNLEMIWVEPGTFMMGRLNKQREITLTKGFYLGKYEVTQEQYEKVMGNNPSLYKGGKLPVEMVSWYDAVAFCEALNNKKKKKRGWVYSLPTEAQWEYACRAGTTTLFSWGDTIASSNANYGRNIGRTTNVGSYAPNPWGFFDMHGNVSEFCDDTLTGLHINSEVGIRGWYRGGAWNRGGPSLRAGLGGHDRPPHKSATIGFRVAFQQVKQASEGSLGSSGAK